MSSRRSWICATSSLGSVANTRNLLNCDLKCHRVGRLSGRIGCCDCYGLDAGGCAGVKVSWRRWVGGCGRRVARGEGEKGAQKCEREERRAERVAPEMFRREREARDDGCPDNGRQRAGAGGRLGVGGGGG